MSAAPESGRTLLHVRKIDAQGFRRADGLYDIEVRLCDTKTFDRAAPAGVRRAGEPIHDMTLCLTLDAAMTIVDATTTFSAVPYLGTCEGIAASYRSLAGMKLAPGFSAAVRERLGGTRGCTHMTDLIAIAATTAFQTIGREAAATQDPESKPFQLDRCHALRTDGPAVAKYFPRWAKGARKDVA